MHTHHLVKDVTLFVGAIVAVLLSVAVGSWLDKSGIVRDETLLAFLAATAVVVVAVEAGFGSLGTRLERRLHY